MIPADKTRLPVAATPGADKGSMGPVLVSCSAHGGGDWEPLFEASVPAGREDPDTPQ
jgi:hypothetical protein